MQFDTTINEWHTCPNSGRINASNPCSEYMHLDDSACNLASLNLLQFTDANGTFDVAAFRHAGRTSRSPRRTSSSRARAIPRPRSPPTRARYRELGLGYANLGALLMSLGLPYDSKAGGSTPAPSPRSCAGQAYAQSAVLAQHLGPYEGYAKNDEPQLHVIEKHRGHAYKLDSALVPLDLLAAARDAWDGALTTARAHGVRNSQVTVLAPTGTIAFMMDCDTTGIEPDIALVKYKKLVGGGVLKIINNTVPRALRRLGYDSREVQEIVEYIDEQETIEGAPALRAEHLAVFDCAFRPARGVRTIHHLGHIRMMGAVQPFISGAISKTINMPEAATVEEIEDAYVQAWKLGSRRSRSTATVARRRSRSTPRSRPKAAAAAGPSRRRRSARCGGRLPTDRTATCHKFDIAGHEGYIHVGFYEDGTPGEIFVKMAKEGSTISGLMDTDRRPHRRWRSSTVCRSRCWCRSSATRASSRRIHQEPDIPMAKSLIDYLFRFLGTRFLGAEARSAVGLVEREEPAAGIAREVEAADAGAARGFAFSPQADAPSCSDCGALMVRNGSCYKCLNCGATSGCS
jgi:ribonucleoside-diphosphate reductase alpha chain